LWTVSRTERGISEPCRATLKALTKVFQVRLSGHLPSRQRRPDLDPRAALEVHQFDGYTATLYPGMVEFSLDQTAVRPAGQRRQEGGGA
jgi:hypothetical protein